jgi:ornithine cyclodeaminase
VIKRADVFVDDLNACEVEAGDLIQAEAQGWSWGMVYGNLAELVSSKAGRQNPMRITLFKSVGLALEDLVVAKHLVSNFQGKN